MKCYLPCWIVKRHFPIPRWVLWALFIGLASVANHSHAQAIDCTKNQALSKATPLDASYLLKSSNTNRIIFKAEIIHVEDCKSFTLNTQTIHMAAIVNLAMLKTTPVITSTSPLNAKMTFQLQCTFAGVCFDSTGKDLFDSVASPKSGIEGTLEIFYSGLDSKGNQCFTVTDRSFYAFSNNDNQLSPLPSLIATTDCKRITMKAILTVQQTGAFYKPNVATIKWITTSTSLFQFSVNSFFGGTGGFQPLTLNVQNGTCAIGLSNSSMSFGVLKPSEIQALANGGVAKTLPFSLEIGNCVGTSLGKNKMLRWIFDDPRQDDFTQMSNSPFGSAKGVSAQIIADAKFDTAGNAMANNIITNGEKYMSSGKAADVQKLNYKVNIIRNSDAVVEGSFSSKATVVLDYQ